MLDILEILLMLYSHFNHIVNSLEICLMNQYWFNIAHYSKFRYEDRNIFLNYAIRPTVKIKIYETVIF